MSYARFRTVMHVRLRDRTPQTTACMTSQERALPQIYTRLCTRETVGFVPWLSAFLSSAIHIGEKLEVRKFGTERDPAQDPLIRYAEEVGWAYVSTTEVLPLRKGERKYVGKDYETRKTDQR